jgi:hypothetical protein
VRGGCEDAGVNCHRGVGHVVIVAVRLRGVGWVWRRLGGVYSSTAGGCGVHGCSGLLECCVEGSRLCQVGDYGEGEPRCVGGD